MLSGPVRNPITIAIGMQLPLSRESGKIIVIDKGEVKESGTHEELLLLENGIYRNLSSLQIEVMG